MTVAIDALTAPRSRRVASLGERLLEFMLVGGFTLVLFPLSWALRAAFGLEAVELAVGFSMFHWRTSSTTRTSPSRICCFIATSRRER